MLIVWKYIFLDFLTHQYAYPCLPENCALRLNSFWHRRDKEEANKTVSQIHNEVAYKSEQPTLENTRNVPAVLQKTWQMSRSLYAVPRSIIQLRKFMLPQWHQYIVASLLLLDMEEPESVLVTELIGVRGWLALPQWLRPLEHVSKSDLSCLWYQNESGIISPVWSYPGTSETRNCYLFGYWVVFISIDCTASAFLGE